MKSRRRSECKGEVAYTSTRAVVHRHGVAGDEDVRKGVLVEDLFAIEHHQLDLADLLPAIEFSAAEAQRSLGIITHLGDALGDHGGEEDGSGTVAVAADGHLANGGAGNYDRKSDAKSVLGDISLGLI